MTVLIRPLDVKNRTDHVLWRNNWQSFQAQYIDTTILHPYYLQISYMDYFYQALALSDNQDGRQNGRHLSVYTCVHSILVIYHQIIMLSNESIDTCSNLPQIIMLSNESNYDSVIDLVRQILWNGCQFAISWKWYTCIISIQYHCQ